MADPHTSIDADGDAILIDYEEALVFSLTGVVDAQLQNEMTPDRPALVVNLSGVTFIDSSAIGLLFDLARRSHRRRLRYAIVAPTDQPIRSVLMLAGIDVVATIVESVPEALERVAEPE
jgi:anti-anti-sigma factor